jgi:membrane-associated PAP2 superfamily phosphatase
MGFTASMPKPTINTTAQHWQHRDLWVALFGLLLLLGWDATGWDLIVMHSIADTSGFPWRHHWLTSQILHQGARWLSWGIVLALMLETVLLVKPGPTRKKRCAYLTAILACAMLVPLLKQFSLTSCPWDLSDFGGRAHYVSHWTWGMADGGGGHCFPSGHAVSAFGFLGMYFLWRDHDHRFARAWLYGVLLAGMLFGLTQTLRGAHYPSHTAWTAWLCWTIFSSISLLTRIRRHSPECR